MSEAQQLVEDGSVGLEGCRVAGEVGDDVTAVLPEGHGDCDPQNLQRRRRCRRPFQLEEGLVEDHDGVRGAPVGVDGGAHLGRNRGARGAHQPKLFQASHFEARRPRDIARRVRRQGGSRGDELKHQEQEQAEQKRGVDAVDARFVQRGLSVRGGV